METVLRSLQVDYPRFSLLEHPSLLLSTFIFLA